MPRKKYTNKVKCPRCEKIFIEKTNHEWIGTTQKLSYCLECRRNKNAFGFESQTRTYKKKQTTLMNSLLEERGLSREQKIQLDKYCEMKSWKARSRQVA